MTDIKKPTPNSLYAKAEKALRAKHADEFDILLTQAYNEAGMTRKTRRTTEQREAEEAAARLAKAEAKSAAAKEKAKATVEALLAEYPDLVVTGQDDSVEPSGLDEFVSPTV